MPKRKASNVVTLDTSGLVKAAEDLGIRVEEQAALHGRVAHLERAVRALVRRVHGTALPGCTQCRRYAERQVQVSNPRAGSQIQNLCGKCPPKHPLLDRRDTQTTELPLATGALAAAANADLDSILEPANG